MILSMRLGRISRQGNRAVRYMDKEKLAQNPEVAVPVVVC